MPIVSIGMPVYNGEKYLRSAIESILSQSFADFELIISDNGSTDQTSEICEKYALIDPRIRYIRQPTSIGAVGNFNYVLGEAKTDYFMWAAHDDIRSTDFIEVNLNFLKENSDYVASTSPNGFEGVEPDKQTLVDFSLDGDDVFERFTEFFKYCWVSHGIFYSLIRVSTLRNCPLLPQSFFGWDWAIDLFLVSEGKINRASTGYTIFGVRGVSMGPGIYKAFRNDYIEFVIPFYRISKYTLYLSKGFDTREKIRVLVILMKLNMSVNYSRISQSPFFKAYLLPIYHKLFRPIVRRKPLEK